MQHVLWYVWTTQILSTLGEWSCANTCRHVDTHTREHVHPWAESREHFYTISYVKETDCLKCGNKGKDVQFISTAEAHVPSGHSSSLFQGYHPSGDASGRVVLLPSPTNFCQLELAFMVMFASNSEKIDCTASQRQGSNAEHNSITTGREKKGVLLNRSVNLWCKNKPWGYQALTTS